MKYHLNKNEPKEINGVKVYRIYADECFKTIDGEKIKTGTRGGWLESEDNLSQDSNCWVADDAVVCGKARIHNSAVVRGKARIQDAACIQGCALISGEAIVSDEANVFGHDIGNHYTVHVYGSAHISDYAEVYGESRVYENAHICDEATICGKSIIRGNAMVEGKGRVRDSIIKGNTKICGDTLVCIYASISGGTIADSYIRGDAESCMSNKEQTFDEVFLNQ